MELRRHITVIGLPVAIATVGVVITAAAIGFSGQNPTWLPLVLAAVNYSALWLAAHNERLAFTMYIAGTLTVSIMLLGTGYAGLGVGTLTLIAPLAYGWWKWRRPGPITRAPLDIVLWLLAAAVIVAGNHAILTQTVDPILVLTVFGQLLLAHRRVDAWQMLTLAAAATAIIDIANGNWTAVPNDIAYVALSIYGWWLWRRDVKPDWAAFVNETRGERQRRHARAFAQLRALDEHVEEQQRTAGRGH